MMLDGRLPAGRRLPAIRHLARDLGLSRNTVVGAIDQLRAEGYLVALERQARHAGAQRAALERQGYDGVATVTAEGRAHIQWFADRARRQPGSGA